MIETSTSKFQSLIYKAKPHFMPSAEMTFFDIGMRGHYENPTTDLFAFFLDPAGQHNLGDSFIRGLLTAIGVEADEAGPVVSVNREVAIDGGRIDLIVKFEHLLLVVECKIYHHQNNPFTIYESYSNKFFPEHQKRFVILSIDGESNASGWQGLSYESLVQHTRVFLGPLPEYFGSNKWTVLASEFLRHLENFGIIEMNNNQFNFIAENLPNIAKLKELERRFYDEVHKIVSIESGFDDVIMTHETWDDDKVLRFKRTGWNELHDCALRLGGTGKLTVVAMAWVYADGFYPGNDKQPLIHKFSELLGNFVFKHKEIERWRGEDWWYCEWDSKLTIREGVLIAAYILKALDSVDCRRTN